MNESMDRVLTDWLHEGPETGPREGLERTLAATRRVGQRPGWTFPERWLPMQLDATRTAVPSPMYMLTALMLLLLAVFAAAILAGSARREPPPALRDGAVVYEQGGDLYLVDQLGGTARPLVTGSDWDTGAVFSPKGDRIAFLREDALGNGAVMTARADGSGLTQLSDDRGWGGAHLVWAPDGSALAVTAGGGGWWLDEIRILAADGSRTWSVTAGKDVRVGLAAWRPDGRHIAFLAGQDGAFATYVADADGTAARRLALEADSERVVLAWSPDGDRLAFVGSDGGRSNLTIAAIDAGGEITASTPIALDPDWRTVVGVAWSPEGDELAAVVRGDREQVAVLSVDGSASRTVETDLSQNIDVFWSADGRSLVMAGDGPRTDPVSGYRDVGPKTWVIDLASGERQEIIAGIGDWQRLAP
jgi:Tol biopolymer transport system component